MLQSYCNAGDGGNLFDGNAAAASTTSLGDVNMASIASPSENEYVQQVCGESVCFLGNNPANVDTMEGDWYNGDQIMWTNWQNYEMWSIEAAIQAGDITATDDNRHQTYRYMTMRGQDGMTDGDGNDITGMWYYTDGEAEAAGVCEVAANMDTDLSYEADAR